MNQNEDMECDERVTGQGGVCAAVNMLSVCSLQRFTHQLYENWSRGAQLFCNSSVQVDVISDFNTEGR